MSESSKTRTGRVLQVPTPENDAAIIAAAQDNPDAMPFTDAEWARIKPLARRGRPLGSGTKTQITLRLDADLVNEFKATGPGWQSRINTVLREAVAHGLVKGWPPEFSPQPGQPADRGTPSPAAGSPR